MSDSIKFGYLRGVYKANSWGKEASSSIISDFDSDSSFPKSGPLAELWFGTHGGGVSELEIKSEKTPLNDLLSSNFNEPNLSYLAKILTVKEILSIQLHPDLENAKRLHELRPSSYPDASDKPEMAIALSQGELLCGLRPLSEILNLLETHPAFKFLIAESKFILKSDSQLRELIFFLFSKTNSEIEKFYEIAISESNTEYEEILRGSYNYLKRFDSGMLIIYLLSIFKLNKGDAVFIDSCIPHAYISGDYFECMKCSDNVVRGGLTPKEIDIDEFCSLIRLEPYNPILKAEKPLPTLSDEVLNYQPKNCPFNVLHINTSNDFLTEIKMEGKTCMIICLKGSGELSFYEEKINLKQGTASFIISQPTNLKLKSNSIEAFFVFEK
jgi:mannose-6-phosphate isomerase